METAKRGLYSALSEQKWNEAQNIYEEHPEILAVKINKSDDTVLHVAITLGAPVSFIVKLVDEIQKNVENAMGTLAAKNIEGDTPLHCAASKGYTYTCRRIIRAGQSLVGERNNEEEITFTPLRSVGLVGKVVGGFEKIEKKVKNAVGLKDPTSPSSHKIRDEQSLVGERNKETALRPVGLVEKAGQSLVGGIEKIEEKVKDAMESKGSTSADRNIVRDGQSLVVERNNEEETPLFLAALNGHRRTFLYLHSVCSKMDRSSSSSLLWKRKNGDTILHCTIRRKYFDLSFQITHLYKDQKIAGYSNDEGVTPLDVLASLPSAFKSCTKLSWIAQLYYHFIDVKELEPPVESQVVDIENSEMRHQTHQQPRRVSERITSWLRGYWCYIREIKQNHVWVAQIMEELVKQDSWYGTELKENAKELHDFWGLDFSLRLLRRNSGLNLEFDYLHKDKKKQSPALLTATKYGEIELVDKILETFPVAIHDKTSEKKNIVLVAVEERQTHILKRVMKHRHWPVLREAVDEDGNNALHLAAKISRDTTWETHGSAMQMQWEVKWFEYVKGLMPAHFASQKNKKEQTPGNMFEVEHKKLIKQSNMWLRDTSGVYTAVSTLIASGTFATCLQVPGGTNDQNGKPTLVGQTAFDLFAIAVLFAFTFSSTAMVGFVAVYSSRKKPKDYRRDLPLKLSLGLASLFVSGVSVLLAFYAAHSYEARVVNKFIPLYFLTVLPIGVYTAIQFPTYSAFFKEALTNEPRPSFVEEDITRQT